MTEQDPVSNIHTYIYTHIYIYISVKIKRYMDDWISVLTLHIKTHSVIEETSQTQGKYELDGTEIIIQKLGVSTLHQNKTQMD